MSNRIDTGHVTHLAQTPSRTDTERPAATGGFADVMERIRTGQVAGAQAAGDPAAMSLEEYKAAIAQKISSLPMSASTRMENISVHISDAGFEAMRSDPEYEEWVLDTLAQNFRFQNPWTGRCGGGYVVHTFGATKEQYHGESWFPGYQNGRGASLWETKTQGSFWEKRAERQRQNTELRERLAAKRKMQAKLRSGESISIAELLLGLG